MDRDKFKNRVEEIVKSEDHFLIDLNFKGDSRNHIIEIFVDNKEGVSTEGCAVISRKIEEYIDQENLFDGKYRLDVSSPGVDRNLVYLDQYYKHKNRKFKIKYASGSEEKLMEAKLKDVKDDRLLFQHKNEEIEIEFDKIKSAKVIISF